MHTEFSQKFGCTIHLQEDINKENVVEVLGRLVQLVAMTSAIGDQSTANLEIILDVVSASRDIASDTSLNTSQMAEVSTLISGMIIFEVLCTCI